MSSSDSEQIIPEDSTPLIDTRDRTNGAPEGSCWLRGTVAPTRPTGTFCPTATFGAPQTTCRVSRPIPTVQTDSRSARGCFSLVRTSPTTNPL